MSYPAPRKGQIGIVGDPQAPVAKLITRVTKSTVFHVVVCVSDTMIVSADGGGIALLPIGAYPTAMWSDYGMTAQQAEVVADFAIRQVGLPYNWANDLLIGLQFLGVDVPDFLYRASEDRHAYQCAQLGAAALEAGGVKPFDRKVRKGTPCPGDFEVYFREQGWFRGKVPAATP